MATETHHPDTRRNGSGRDRAAADWLIRGTQVVITNFIFRTSEYDALTVWALHLPAALPPVQGEIRPGEIRR